MDNTERISALDVALDNEKTERDFYLEHARRTKNPLGKAMFLLIADDELEHYERLGELHDKWMDSRKWPENVPLSVRQTKVRGLIEGLRSEDAGLSDDDDMNALEVAAAFEAKGAEFYARLSDEVADPKEKAFFALMAGIEREHYLSIRDAQEYLKDPEGWLMKSERSNLDGA